MFKKKKKKQESEEKPDNPSFQTITIEVEKDQASMDAKQFMLWGLLGSITILFTGLLIAHIILWGQGSEYGQPVPWSFYLSTVIILFSSYTLYQASTLVKEDDIEGLQTTLRYTFFLGLFFLASQAVGWYSMLGEISGSGDSALVFIYLLSGLHGFHILAGLGYLGITLRSAYNFSIHSRNRRSFNNCCTFWHYLGGLWIYVFLAMVIF